MKAGHQWAKFLAMALFILRDGAIGRPDKPYLAIFSGHGSAKVDTYDLLGRSVAPVAKNEQALSMNFIRLLIPIHFIGGFRVILSAAVLHRPT